MRRVPTSEKQKGVFFCPSADLYYCHFDEGWVLKLYVFGPYLKMMEWIWQRRPGTTEGTWVYSRLRTRKTYTGKNETILGSVKQTWVNHSPTDISTNMHLSARSLNQKQIHMYKRDDRSSIGTSKQLTTGREFIYSNSQDKTAKKQE